MGYLGSRGFVCGKREKRLAKLHKCENCGNGSILKVKTHSISKFIIMELKTCKNN